MEEKFQIGAVVCLTFDESKRFIVTSPEIDGKIGVSYFSDYHKEITEATIAPKYLMKL